MSLAIKHALLERNVSHLIFPDEVQTLPAPEGLNPSSPQGRITPLQIAPPPQSLDSAVDLLKSSQRPVIIVGHGSRFND